MAENKIDQYLDTSPELTLENVKQQTIKGIVALTGRTFLLQIISLLATFFLTIYLDPSQYGIFFLVSAIINFFAYFSDVGLAAALIQKKERLSPEELKATFTVQQILVLTLIVLIFVLTPFFQVWYKMEQASIYLLWALAVSLFFSSLKTIPSIILERKLDFNRLVLPQIIETLAFNIIAVWMAWEGFGVTSFTVAVLVRGILGVTIMYLLQPWKPGIVFSKKALSPLFHFGIPYQMNTLLALIKDDGMTIFLGSILGTGGIGLLGWAQKWAAAPLRFFMDQVIRVTFPTFSRLQGDKENLSKAVNKSIFFICLTVFPAIVMLLVLAPILVEIIPKYEKWRPALLALSVLTINTMWAAVTTPLTNLLNAVGKITITFRLMIMWTVLTWIINPLLALNFGVDGVAWGFAIIGSSSIIAIKVASQYVKIDFWNNVGKVGLAAICMALGMKFISTMMYESALTIIILIIVGSIFYLGAIFILYGASVFEEAKDVYLAFRRRQETV